MPGRAARLTDDRAGGTYLSWYRALIIGLPAVTFALPHRGNLAIYGNNPAQLAPDPLVGATYGWAAWYTGTLWLPATGCGSGRRRQLPPGRRDPEDRSRC